MSVAIDETRNDRLSPKVYDFRRRSCHLTDLVTRANCAKPSIRDCDGFNDTEFFVHGHNFAVDEYRIRESRRKNTCCPYNSAEK
jgi:hypothetical protein